MYWTEEVPEKDGFYWLRRNGKSDTIVKIRDSKQGLINFGAMVTWIGTDWDLSLCEVVGKQNRRRQ